MVSRKEKKIGVIVFPTDTAYGIGCDATDRAAVRRVFAIKGRVRGKALPMIVADLKMAQKFFRISKFEFRISKKYWPGPLSIVLPVRSKKIAKEALYRGTAAVRVPDSRLARALSKKLGAPLIATSANRSGEPARYSVKGLRLPVDAVLDAGALPRRKPSTIVRVQGSKIIVLRNGPIKIQDSRF
jgi:L-threonylcarbamoyladenylate synthase